MEQEKKTIPFFEKVKAVWQKIKDGCAKAKPVLSVIGKILYHLRKVVLAAPVVYALVRLYAYAKEQLPEEVGLLLQENGEYAYMIAKDTALNGCVIVTAACLLMMILSRRTIYPWIISVFSLVLPFVLILTNVFPA